MERFVCGRCDDEIVFSVCELMDLHPHADRANSRFSPLCAGS